MWAAVIYNTLLLDYKQTSCVHFKKKRFLSCRYFTQCKKTKNELIQFPTSTRLCDVFLIPNDTAWAFPVNLFTSCLLARELLIALIFSPLFHHECVQENVQDGVRWSGSFEEGCNLVVNGQWAHSNVQPEWQVLRETEKAGKKQVDFLTVHWPPMWWPNGICPGMLAGNSDYGWEQKN